MREETIKYEQQRYGFIKSMGKMHGKKKLYHLALNDTKLKDINNKNHMMKTSKCSGSYFPTKELRKLTFHNEDLREGRRREDRKEIN